jgi:predicted kinase
VSASESSASVRAEKARLEERHEALLARTARGPGLVTILVGIPGSGKSRYAQLRADLGKDLAVVVSADALFSESGTYRFDPSRLGEAHAQCMRRFVEAMRAATELVVVDNTNTTATELAPYYAVARAYGYDVEVVRFACDPAVGASRNAHGVPFATCLRMAAAVEALSLPPYWNVTERTETG